ncbi:MAG: LamG domain-containing protein [Pirellula sp.]|nr:LamG domain-containing protein [Pirellula sp.]
MISRLCATTLFFTASHSLAVDLTPIPNKPIAEKKELLFSDDFEGTEPAKVWHKVVPTFVFEKGVIKGTQTRDKDVPATDTKPIIKAHAAVHGLEIPTKDSVVEVKIRFEGASMIDVEFDDRKFTGAHYGHICRAQVRLTGVTLIDEKDGGMRSDIYEMKKDPSKKAEVAKMVAGRSVTYPAKLEAGKWYTLVVETVGDEMRVTLDGQPAGYLKSSGIAHASKSKIEIGVAGKDGLFDDLKVWNAQPAK